MKHFVKFVVAVLVTASSSVAHASLLNGTLAFTGKSTTSSTGITFKSGLKVAANSTPHLRGTTMLGRPAGFTDVFTKAGISGNSGGEQMLGLANSAGTQKLLFVVNAYGMVGSGLTYFGMMSLYHHAAGRADMPVSSNNAVLSYNKVDGQDFTASISTTPEPSSLILLGTGLGVLGLMLRRRRGELVQA